MKKYNIKKFLVILCGFVVIGTSSCGKKVDVKRVREAVTIQDLYNLLQ